jgi:hypothetical protein
MRYLFKGFKLPSVLVCFSIALDYSRVEVAVDVVARRETTAVILFKQKMVSADFMDNQGASSH